MIVDQSESFMTSITIITVIFVIVGEIIIASICAALAKSKGRSSAGWFFLSLFILSWIAIVILAVLDRHQNPYAGVGPKFKTSDPPKDTWVCSCGGRNPNYSSSCTSCGVSRPKVQASPRKVMAHSDPVKKPKVVDDKEWMCDNCGRMSPATASFCYYCREERKRKK